jgi:hypothetical protein
MVMPTKEFKNTPADPPVEGVSPAETPSAKAEPAAEPPLFIEKPAGGGLSRFKTTKPASGRVEKLQQALPHYKLSDARDYARLHPNEEAYWSEEYFFVAVPVQGQKNDVLHLIAADLAEQLPSGRVQRFRLALATKPYDVFFLAHVPSQNLDNEWNRSSLEACGRAKKSWLMAVSKKAEGKEGYQVRIFATGLPCSRSGPRPVAMLTLGALTTAGRRKSPSPRPSTTIQRWRGQVEAPT